MLNVHQAPAASTERSGEQAAIAVSVEPVSDPVSP
jgi:hypothetical protein